ncbi:MAG TPA: hypothetical protein DEG17_14690 [Cyanobacteria bacterium UBA11149]|nr:hypothetical protein [Cyanobacteria bacterium UBA11367]HBE58556.1 hypothetical protein [Cyanobacteria bacterium UBA11366]HBK64773.1 hypothetical protein [Cyanobacteria bacterium UBA11166]HBR76508.1 hypothetical protein [Cyanobacteria bacterium UBA11159]HBS67878.1 hypothetical protein [Cyanobacteria bacterium UBA11153]HBW90083.1 hypothetical protein [Cyanobacteria bacterium UBA11149]HCA93729.1 hypothetical protein [Cyanobacteria bacterium UBA9226]
MSEYVVTILDTTGIQSYIFNSNRLRENIGASYLISQATGDLDPDTDDWVKKKIEDLGVPKNRQQEPIKDSGLNAELVYAGGGNAMLLFKSMNIAKNFTHKLSRQILEHAPGLNIVAAHCEFHWDNDCLYEKVEKLQTEELEKQKRARIPSSSLLGLGVTAFCNSTQLPAVTTNEGYVKNIDEEDICLVSRETEAKLKQVSSKHGEPANKALKKRFADVLKQTDYEFPYRMDHLGRSRGESSYYAVIHADGNGMGERFKEYGKDSRDNLEYLNRMRGLSNSVNQASLAAVKKVVNVLINSIDSDGKVMGKFPIFSQNGTPYLPFRPLVYGGDDVTFVCDGRLGLALAAIYLQALQEPLLHDGKQMTACAGVCIVKSHYPFARAYALSEALCNNAKKFVREQKQQWGKEFSGIDWHIAASGLFGTIGDIRQREYQVPTGELTMRPVLIQEEENQWRTWSNFINTVECFNGNRDEKESQEWKERKNKILALREKLREGQQATKQFRKAYRIDRLPLMKGGDEIVLRETGWTEEHCGYFDAIEAMEFYFPLNQGVANDYLQVENEAVE